MIRIAWAIRSAWRLGSVSLATWLSTSTFHSAGGSAGCSGAIAQNPRLLGVGIDEDTAIIAREGEGFDVVGNGAVYVVSGQSIVYTNLSDTKRADTISVHNVKLDVLSRGDKFDLKDRVAVHS